MEKTKKNKKGAVIVTKADLLNLINNLPSGTTVEEMMDITISNRSSIRTEIEKMMSKEAKRKIKVFLNERTRQQILTVFKIHGNNEKPLTFFDFMSYINSGIDTKVSYQRVAIILREVAERKILCSTDCNGCNSKQTIYEIKPSYKNFI